MSGSDFWITSRRGFLAGLGGAMISLDWMGRNTVAQPDSETESWTDWSMPRYNTAGTSAAPFESVGGEQFEKRWSVPIDSQTNNVNSYFEQWMPIVHEGIVFHDRDDTLEAYRAETGQQGWIYEADHSIRVGPVADRETIYIGGDGTISAVSIDGKQRWSTSVESDLDSLVPTESGVVYVGYNDIGFLNSAGESVWERSESYIEKSFTVDENNIYIFSEDELIGVDLETGDTIRNHTLTRWGDPEEIIIYGSHVFGFDDSSVYQYDLDSDTSDIVFSDFNTSIEDLAVTSDAIYFVGEAGYGGALTLRKKERNGLTLSSITLSGDYRSGLVATESTVYVDTGNAIEVVDAESMEVIGSIEQPHHDSVLSLPAIANRIQSSEPDQTSLFVADNDTLYRIDHSESGTDPLYLDSDAHVFGQEFSVNSSFPSIVGLGIGTATSLTTEGVSRKAAATVYPELHEESPSSDDETESEYDADSDSSGYFTDIWNASLPSLGYFLVFSWFLMAVSMLGGGFLRYTRPSLIGIGASERLLFWQIISSFTTVLAFASGVAGAVVIARTFDWSRRTQMVMASSTAIAGFSGLYLANFTRLHISLGYEYAPIIAGSIFVVPFALLIPGFLLRYLFASRSTGRTWFLIALIAPVYLFAHTVAMPWLTEAPTDNPMIWIFLGHGVMVPITLLGILLILGGVLSSHYGNRPDSDFGGSDSESIDRGQRSVRTESGAGGLTTVFHRMGLKKHVRTLSGLWLVVAILYLSMAYWRPGGTDAAVGSSFLLGVTTVGSVLLGIVGLSYLTKSFGVTVNAAKRRIWGYFVTLVVCAAVGFFLSDPTVIGDESGGGAVQVILWTPSFVPFLVLFIGVPLKRVFDKRGVDWLSYSLALLAVFYPIAQLFMTEMSYHITQAGYGIAYGPFSAADPFTSIPFFWLLIVGHVIIVPLSLSSLVLAPFPDEQSGATDQTPPSSSLPANHDDSTHSDQRDLESGSEADEGTEQSVPEGTDDPSLRTAEKRSDEDAIRSPRPSISGFVSDCDAIDGVRASIDDSNPISLYEARLSSQDTLVYVLAPEHADHEFAPERFSEAAQRWAGISQNPHIATVHEWGTDPRPWVAFDGDGRPLETVVDQLDRTERLRVLDSVFEGLQTASLYSVSNNSLAPDTVIVSTDGSELTAELADWGLGDDVKTALGKSTASPYTAPEQLNAETSPTTDVYRVGMLAYRLLTDREPFGESTHLASDIRDGNVRPPSEVADVPERFDEILARATAVNPTDRYSSLSELQNQIRGLF